MLPNLLCIGAQKSGTTSLWQILDAHPEICMARPRETRFFSDATRFAEGAGRYELNHLADWAGQVVVGDKCPECFFERESAQRIHDTLGREIRLIVALRNPAQRAFSHYRHNRAMLRECRSFEEAIDTELAAQARGEPVSAAFAYLARGRYAPQLERYRVLFGPERILVVHFESEVAMHQDGLVQRVYDFLEVRPFAPAGVPFREGHPPLDGLQILLNQSAPVPRRQFVEIVRNRRTSSSFVDGLRHVLGKRDDRTRVYNPSAALRQFAESFTRTAPTVQQLSWAEALELNTRYFREDMDRLQALVPFPVADWLAEAPAQC